MPTEVFLEKCGGKRVACLVLLKTNFTMTTRKPLGCSLDSPSSRPCKTAATPKVKDDSLSAEGAQGGLASDEGVSPETKGVSPCAFCCKESSALRSPSVCGGLFDLAWQAIRFQSGYPLGATLLHRNLHDELFRYIADRRRGVPVYAPGKQMRRVRSANHLPF